MENKDFYLGLIAGMRAIDITRFLPYSPGLKSGLEAAVKKAGEEGVVLNGIFPESLMQVGRRYALLAPDGNYVKIALDSRERGMEYLECIDPGKAEFFKTVANAFLEKFEMTCIEAQVFKI